MPLTKEQRAEISRANGRKSRGPKTDWGKFVSSCNSFKHGLSAKEPDPDLVEAERINIELLLAYYQPRNDFEFDMVRRMAIARARFWHVTQVENQHIAATASLLEAGMVMMRFDRYKAAEENRYGRLLAFMEKARNNKKLQQNEPDFFPNNQCVMKNGIPSTNASATA